MESQGLGTPIVSNRTVESVYKEISDIQGNLLTTNNNNNYYYYYVNKILRLFH